MPSKPSTGTSSTATPAMPATRPPITRPLGRWRVTIASNTASQIGTVATSTAATPVGMSSSESTTPPFPPSSSSVPTIAAVRHCDRGRPLEASRRAATGAWATSTASMISPAEPYRAPAASSGGIVSIITAMPR